MIRVAALPLPQRRPIIGLLESELDRSFHRAALLSISEAAYAAGAQVVCFDGGVLAGAHSPAGPANALYDLVDAGNVDGLIIWASALDWELRAEQMEAFCRRFAPIPVVTVGRAFRDIPGVLVDNYQGMRLAAKHLIREHGLRGLAFLRGPEGAEEEVLRYRAYCDVLAENAIPFDPTLVSSYTQWTRADGPVVIEELLDHRGLQPGVDFQGLLSVGDDMACGAIEALRTRGYRIPDDVAVVGFNNDDEGRAILPALTTVSQPVVEMGRTAVRTLLDLMAGRPVAAVVNLPLELIVRRSCGCLSPAVVQAAARIDVTPETPLDATGVLDTMARLTGLSRDELDSLVAAFLSSVAGEQPGNFLAALNGELQATALGQYPGIDVRQWHDALSVMRQQMLPLFVEPQRSLAENLWQQARVLIGETATQLRTYQRFRADQDTHRLGDFSQHIQTATDRHTLFEILTNELPAFGVSAVYLVLYEDAQRPTGAARLVMGYTDRGRLDLTAGPRRFMARELLPADVRALQGERLVVLPLYFGQRQLGYLALCADARGLALSEAFREQISSALEGLSLREEIQQAWQKAEGANLLKSRFLSTVSHELRTPLSLIVGTIEMMQRLTPGDVVTQGPPESFQRDLESIHTSARHLSHLIADVLDLARSQAGELRLVCEPIRLAEVLERVAVLGEQMARERGLAWRVDFGVQGPCQGPLVWGDRTRLQQVALNLISNAVKFTAKGSVALWIEVGRQEVLVAVSDTGMGIPLTEQELIFDEFRQSDRATRRGFGGMGLGLAISKRLIELHGGHIGVLSTGADGAGSTFYFTLPILAQAAVAADRLPDRSDSVLLLTEQGSSDDRLQDYLTRQGFKVAVLPITEESDWLAQVIAAPPGAVVLDYEPAAERAWDLMHVLKLNPATSDIPVLFYSLTDDDCGAVLNLDYLSKPIGGDVLAAALARQGMVRGDGRAHAILIVDDDPAMRELHMRMLQTALPTCRVTTVADGRSALSVMQEARPDLVLLDLMMPELDGFGVLEAMRIDLRLRDVPVVVLTAQLLGRAEMERLQRGVVAVLGKGLFSQDEVLIQVGEALARGGKRLGSEAQRIARMAMAYIHEHYAEPMSREELSRRLAVSERYLTRCFGQETGLTPVAYLNRYRVQQASEMLRRGQLTITEIALACGFSDSSYFGRVFQKEIGLTPSEFRRRATDKTTSK